MKNKKINTILRIHDLQKKLDDILETKLNKINKRLLESYNDNNSTINNLINEIKKETYFIGKNNNILLNLNQNKKTTQNQNQIIKKTNCNLFHLNPFIFPSFNSSYNVFDKYFIYCLNTYLKKERDQCNYIIVDIFKTYKLKYTDFIISLFNRFNKKKTVLLTQKKILNYEYKKYEYSLNIIKNNLIKLRSNQIELFISKNLDKTLLDKYVNNKNLLSSINETFFFDNYKINTVIKKGIKIEKKITTINREKYKNIKIQNKLLNQKKHSNLTKNTYNGMFSSRFDIFKYLHTKKTMKFYKNIIDCKQKFKKTIKILKNEILHKKQYILNNVLLNNIHILILKESKILYNSRKTQLNIYIAKKINRSLIEKFIINDDLLNDEKQTFFFDNQLIEVQKSYLNSYYKII